MASLRGISAMLAILGAVEFKSAKRACKAASDQEREKAKHLVTHGDDFAGIMDGPKMMGPADSRHYDGRVLTRDQIDRRGERLPDVPDT